MQSKGRRDVEGGREKGTETGGDWGSGGERGRDEGVGGMEREGGRASRGDGKYKTGD